MRPRVKFIPHAINRKGEGKLAEIINDHLCDLSQTQSRRRCDPSYQSYNLFQSIIFYRPFNLKVIPALVRLIQRRIFITNRSSSDERCKGHIWCRDLPILFLTDKTEFFPLLRSLWNSFNISSCLDVSVPLFLSFVSQQNFAPSFVLFLPIS